MFQPIFVSSLNNIFFIAYNLTLKILHPNFIFVKKVDNNVFFQNTDGKRAMDDIQIGIGDMSKSTGVSSRQLRYWEEKGYIKSINEGDGNKRKFTINEYYHIRLIKHLNASIEKAEERRQQLLVLRRFGVEIIKDVEVTDKDKHYGKIDLGKVCNDENKHAYGIVTEDGCSIEIEKEGEE